MMGLALAGQTGEQRKGGPPASHWGQWSWMLFPHEGPLSLSLTEKLPLHRVTAFSREPCFSFDPELPEKS